MGSAEIGTIENAVQARSYNDAKILILKLAKKLSISDPMHFQICDWYRRLGLFSLGFSHLNKLSERIGKKTPSSLEFSNQETLWRIRFLNLMGAKEFALELANSFSPSSFDEFRILGNLHQSNFDPVTALPLFRKMVIHDKNPVSHLSLINRTSLAECLFDNGLEDEAIEELRAIISIAESSKNMILLGSAYQSLGEFFARRRQFKEALAVLQKGRDSFPSSDQSWDRGFLIKWQAYTHAQLGNTEKAKIYFREAAGLLLKKSYRPEPYLHLLLLKASVKLASAQESRVLFEFPGLNAGFKAEISRYLGDVKPASQKLGAGYVFSIAKEEYRDQNGHWHLGIPKELLFFHYVNKAGHIGLPQTVACSLLWPGSARIFLSLLPRLNQLAHRLRSRHGIKVEQRQLRIHDLSKIKSMESSAPFPAIFGEFTSFSKKQFAKFYNLSQPHANIWIKQWREKKWLVGKRSRSGVTLTPSRVLIRT